MSDIDPPNPFLPVEKKVLSKDLHRVLRRELGPWFRDRGARMKKGGRAAWAFPAGELMLAVWFPVSAYGWMPLVGTEFRVDFSIVVSPEQIGDFTGLPDGCLADYYSRDGLLEFAELTNRIHREIRSRGEFRPSVEPESDLETRFNAAMTKWWSAYGDYVEQSTRPLGEEDLQRRRDRWCKVYSEEHLVAWCAHVVRHLLPALSRFLEHAKGEKPEMNLGTPSFLLDADAGRA